MLSTRFAEVRIKDYLLQDLKTYYSRRINDKKGKYKKQFYFDEICKYIININSWLINKTYSLEDYIEKNKILDATLNSTPNSNIKFNTNMYSGYDQYNQNIGLDTPIDHLYNEKTSVSRNPMDSNWGGQNYTKKALIRGDYKGREVYKYKTPEN